MPVPSERDPVERHLLRDTAYDTLCGAIVAGTLAPGETLHDTELCSWLGLSRTPVREALARLADEGLIEMAPQRYTRVAPLDRAGAHDAFPILASMHALATELAVPRLTPRDLAALTRENELYVRALRARNAPEAHAADDRFHAIFVLASANPEIGRLLERLEPRLHRFEALSGDALPGRRSVAQHQAIVVRACSGDALGAASAARENWVTLGLIMERALAA